MSAIHSGVPERTDGTNTGPKPDREHSNNTTPDSEFAESFRSIHASKKHGYKPGPIKSSEDLSLVSSTQLAEKAENDLPLSSTTTTVAASPFQQGKAACHHPYHVNGCGAPHTLVRQQPQASKKQRIGSTTSVCTNSSKKSRRSTASKTSCKSTASQIQEVAGDELCATLLLACLFCRSSDILPLLSESLCCSSFPLPVSCSSRLLGVCCDPQGCCCCCCRPEGLEFCYQTDRCAHCALACLFCEFLSLCSLALDCGGCGGCLEACCGGDRGDSVAEACCGEAGGGNCPCGLGCGMLQDCCSSSDCLEICLECCSICFPA
nr:keratin-associated protein 10-2-like isoform X2 [Pogona vitticeps]